MKLMDMVLKRARMKMKGQPMAMGMDEPEMGMDRMMPMDPLVMAMRELMEADTPEAKAEAFRAAHDMLHMEHDKYYGDKHEGHSYPEKYGYGSYDKYGKYGK